MRPIENLVTIVDGYFRTYAPEVEVSGQDVECTRAAHRGPNPANRSRIVELLEAASSEKP